MFCMTEEALINPCREKGEPELPGTGLLVINPADAGFVCKKAEQHGCRRHYLYNSKLYVAKETGETEAFFIAGPAVGSPMAVLTLEKLIALGAKDFLVYGWCGSLSAGMQTGDILIPTWGLSEEGTSLHYPLKSQAESSKRLRSRLRSVLQEKTRCHEGPIWTTDAVYRETKGKIAKYGKKGILGVDMEFNAMVTVAAYRRVRLAAAMLVSDQLWGDKWQPAFADKRFRKVSLKVLNTIFELLSFAKSPQNEQ